MKESKRRKSDNKNNTTEQKGKEGAREGQAEQSVLRSKVTPPQESQEAGSCQEDSPEGLRQRLLLKLSPRE